MRRTLLVLFAFGSLAATGPAAVWTPNQLACPTKRAPAKLPDDLAKELRPGRGAPGSVITDAIYAVWRDCLARTKVAQPREVAYHNYVFYRLAVSGLASQVRALGIEPAIIDTAMEIGPDRANPNYANLDNAQALTLVKALQAKGIDVQKLPQSTFQTIVSYMDASSTLWRGLKPSG